MPYHYIVHNIIWIWLWASRKTMSWWWCNKWQMLLRMTTLEFVSGVKATLAALQQCCKAKPPCEVMGRWEMGLEGDMLQSGEGWGGLGKQMIHQQLSWQHRLGEPATLTSCVCVFIVCQQQCAPFTPDWCWGKLIKAPVVWRPPGVSAIDQATMQPATGLIPLVIHQAPQIGLCIWLPKQNTVYHPSVSIVHTAQRPTQRDLAHHPHTPTRWRNWHTWIRFQWCVITAPWINLQV